MHVERAVGINVTSDVVWSVLADVERWPKWTESVTEVIWIEGSGLATGNRVRIKQPGMPALVWTVTDCEPGTSFTWESTRPGLATVGSHRVTPVRQGAATLTLGIRHAGILAPLVGLVSARRTRRYVAMEADGIKRSAEGLGDLH
ncbi:MAG: SRPBCC family protein [Mycobacteriales bacterium]